MKQYLLVIATVISFQVFAQKKDKNFIEPSTKGCTFSTTGKNDYFILEPGYQLILEGKEGYQTVRLVILVTNEIKKIGDVETRVVTETETAGGKPVEISRNYYAFCKETNTVYYFGEDVDMYKDGKVVNHEGSWVAEGANKPGIEIPGTITIGYRYYQEIAPGVALDRAEIISKTLSFNTPAGKFSNCLKTEEGNGLKPKEKEYKIYAPGIGLIKDEELVLIKYGFTDLK